MARLPFNSIFISNENETFEPRQRVRIGGVVLNPGAQFNRDAVFGGMAFGQFVDKDLEITTEGDVSVITGIY